jgi:hypothetical protein
MKNILIVTALLLLITGNAMAVSEYDRCIKEEKSLKTQEAGDCSGLKSMLNPSACYATQKALKEYRGGKCRQIGISENVDFSVPKAIPEKINPPSSTASTVPGNNTASVPTKKDVREIPQQMYTIEQLKEENERLKAEISRLKTENEQLRKTVR